MQYCMVPAVGSAGGLVSMWRESTLLVEQTQKGQNFIALFARIPSSDNLFLIINVYGPQLDAEKFQFFVLLADMVASHSGSVIVGGDFNAVLNIEDRSGGAALSLGDLAFRQFMSDACLEDLSLQGSNFTWFSSRNEGL